MIIESSAPTRVDLAGGTIDIWPLYLFHPGAATVNFAISLNAHCRIETRDDERIILESRDRNVAFETSVAAIDDLASEPRLELISKLVHFYQPARGFHLTRAVKHQQERASAVRRRLRSRVSARSTGCREIATTNDGSSPSSPTLRQR